MGTYPSPIPNLFSWLVSVGDERLCWNKNHFSCWRCCSCPCSLSPVSAGHSWAGDLPRLALTECSCPCRSHMYFEQKNFCHNGRLDLSSTLELAGAECNSRMLLPCSLSQQLEPAGLYLLLAYKLALPPIKAWCTAWDDQHTMPGLPTVWLSPPLLIPPVL